MDFPKEEKESSSLPITNVLKWQKKLEDQKIGHHSSLKKDTLLKAFPVNSLEMFAREFQLAREDADLADLSEEFNKSSKKNAPSLFENSGLMVDNIAYTAKTKENFSGFKSTLKDVLVTPSKVPYEFILTAESLLKPKVDLSQGSKKE